MSSTCTEPEEEMEEEKQAAEESENDDMEGNEGWADVMNKILRTGTGPQDETRIKKKNRNRTFILTKAKTDTEISAKLNRKVEDFEVAKTEGGEGEEAKTVTKTPNDDDLSYGEMRKKMRKRRLEKADWEMSCRKKPDVTQRYKEKSLQRIATKGVVQLFNAIRKRQVTIETKYKEVGNSEVKKEKVLKAMSKQDFLEKLKSSSRSLTPDETQKLKTIKKEKNNEDDGNDATWNILRDDYLIAPQMKDWDKESDSDDHEDVL